MRIKIIGDNNCARATRHLLRKAGFAVTEFLPADVVTQVPHSGYVITIDLAPAPHPFTVNPFRLNPVIPLRAGTLHARPIRHNHRGSVHVRGSFGGRFLAHLTWWRRQLAGGVHTGTRKIAGGRRRHAERVDPF